MGDYYIYNGRLYSSDELMHFKLGFIKPGHKWITREKAPAGSKKNWIYTYANKAKTAVVQEHQGNKYDELAAEMEAEIQEKYGDARTMSPALVEDYNKKKEALDYYRSQASKSREKSKKIDKQLNKAISNKVNETRLTDKVTAFLKHPFSKTKREKAIQKGKNAITKALKQEVRNAKRSTKNFSTNQLSKEQRTEKEVKRQERIKSDKKDIREKAVEYRKKQSELEKLRKSQNKVKGLNIQKNPTTNDNNRQRTNPHYNDNYSSSESYRLYHQNCSNCSVAYDMRERGYDVEAKANSDEKEYQKYDNIVDMKDLYVGNKESATLVEGSAIDSNVYYGAPNATAKKILKEATSGNVSTANDTWPAAYKRQISGGKAIDNEKYVKGLEKEILKGGEGSRGIIDFQWAGYTTGHSVAYEVRNNKVVIIDAQANEEHPISDYYKTTYCMQYMRTDNLEPTEDIKKKVQNK